MNVLTRREREVMLLKCQQGETTPAIGRRLFLSESTVKNHLWKAFHRMGVNNIAQACYRLGQDSGPVADAIRRDEV